MRKHATWILIAVTITVVGVVGFIVIEGYSFLDALYMAVITLSTVGYGEVQPLSEAGKAFTVVLILFGLGFVLYTITTVATAVIEGSLIDFMKGRRMDRRIRELEGHVLVCGYGRVGMWAARALSAAGREIVVVDQDPARVRHATEKGLLAMEGDATEDEQLESAGLERAGALVCALDNDAENVFLAVTARGISRRLLIVARASDEKAEAKLRRAGADRVISLHELGGQRMAYSILQPAAFDFLDVFIRDEALDLRLHEFRVPKGSEVAGKALRDGRLRQDTGAIVIAIRRDGGKFDGNPDPGFVLAEGDELIALGREEQLARLHELLD